MKKISLIMPIYNEEKSLTELFTRSVSVLAEMLCDYEIIAVNDGSSDNSLEVLKKLAAKNQKIKIINFQRNFGQTAAISACFGSATGDVVISIDSDLENNPEDIPHLVEKINQGYDIVSGWRQKRWQGKFITRKLPSILANSLISRITGIKLHDYGCTLKAYRREMIKEISLYGEMHRFIPVYAAMGGAKVTEVIVNYQPRKYGKSNYNLNRTFKVISDLFTVAFLSSYFNRPMHFFGKFGFVSLFSGFLSGIGMFYLKYIEGVHFVQTPLPLLTIFLIVIGILFILMGLLAEILIRIYYESNKKTDYIIKEKINFD